MVNVAVQECSLYSFTINGVKRKTTPADLTARRLANEAKAALQGKQDSLTTAQLDAANSGITAAVLNDILTRLSALEGNT